MVAARGQWIEDQITSINYHTSSRLFFRPSMTSHRDGMFIAVQRCHQPQANDATTICAGYYHDAFPHIGDANFLTVWGATMLDGFDAAVQLVQERIGPCGKF